MVKTQYGSHVLAVGGDVNAALATGVPAGQVKIRTFMASSVLAGLAGIITACSLSSVSTTTATSMEFEAIAATVIGGVSLMGGAGTVWGAILGVFTLLALKNGLILEGINIFVYQILLGTVLVGLVALKGVLPHQRRSL
jgi:simple sugar transport system permease protein